MEKAMGIVFSLFLIAVGAVMRYAIIVQSPDFSVRTVGMILLIVGIIGVIISGVFWGTWGGVRRKRTITTGLGHPSDPDFPMTSTYEEERNSNL